MWSCLDVRSCSDGTAEADIDGCLESCSEARSCSDGIAEIDVGGCLEGCSGASCSDLGQKLPRS